MANLDFLNILAGLDVDDSTQNIQKQLAMISKNLKGLKIPLDIDTKAIQRAMKQVPKDLAIDDNLAEGKSLLLSQLRETYKGQNYEIGKVIGELHKQTVRAEVLINRLDGSVTKENVALAGRYNKDTKGVDWSEAELIQLGTDESIKATQATQQLTKELQFQAKAIADLLKIEQKRALTTEEQAILEYRRATATEKLTSHMLMLKNAQNQGILSETKYLELINQTAIAHAGLTSAQDNVASQQAEINKVKEAQQAYADYKNTLEQVKIYEAMDRKGILVNDSDKAKYKELKESASAYYQQVITSETKAVEQAQRSMELYNAQKGRYKESAEYQKQLTELKKLKQLKNEILAVDSKMQKFKLSRDSLGFSSEGVKHQDPVVSLLRQQREKLSLDYTDQLNKLEKENPYPSITASIDDMNIQLKNGLALNKETLKVSQQQRDVKLKEKYFNAAPVMSTETGISPKIKNQAYGLDHKALFQDVKAMEELTLALGGEHAQLKKNISATSDFGQTLHQFTITTDTNKQYVRDLTYTFREFKDENGNIQRELYKTGEAVRANANRMLGFGEMLKLTLKRMATWAIMGQVVYGVIRKLGEGFRWLLDINKELVQSAIVQGISLSSVNKQLDQYVALGKQLGIPALEIAKVTTELQRQGLSLEDSKERMQTILKLSATGMTTVAQSMQTVTTAVNALGVAHEKAADIILKASMISASDVEGIGEALSKTASSAFAAGMSIEQATGIMAGLIQVTQEGSSQIGNSLKTILARFNAINEETGEYNQELNKVHAALKSIGVEYVTADGQIRNTYDVLKDTAKIWDTLTKNQQAYIATIGAGVRMQSRFYAIMQNFGTIDNFVNTLYDAEGTLADSFETQLTGYESKLNKMRATVEGIWSNIFSEELVDSLLTLTGLGLKGLDALIEGLEKIPFVAAPAATALGAIGATALSWKKGQLGTIFSEMTNGVIDFRQALGKTTEGFSLLFTKSKKMSTVIGPPVMSIKQNMVGLIKQTRTWGDVMMQVKQKVASVKTGMIGLELATTAVGLALQKLVIASIAFAKHLILLILIQKAWEGLYELITNEKALEAMNERLDETITKLEELRAGALEASNIFADFEKLKGKTGAFTSDEQQEYYEISNKIAELTPTLVSGYDEMGNAVITANATLDTFNDALKEQQKLFNQQYRSNFSGQYGELSKQLGKMTDDLDASQKAIEGLLNGETINSKIANQLGLTGASTAGALVIDKNMATINQNATQQQKDILIQRLQSMKAANDKQLHDKQLQMWRQAQPVISSIGEDAQLGAEGMKALQIATRGLDTTSYKTLQQYEGVVTNVALGIKDSESAFVSVFEKYDTLKQKMGNGEISVKDFNLAVEDIRKELEDLLVTINAPVDSTAILRALEAIVDQQAGLQTVIERLTILKGRLGVYDDFASQVSDLHEAFRETGTINLQALMETVEASDGLLTMEQLLLATQEEKLGILDSTVVKMYEAVKAEKDLQLAQAKTIRDEKQKAYNDNPNVDSHAELLAAKKDVEYIKIELATAMDGLLNSFNIGEEAGKQFDYLTTRIQDFNKYLDDMKENKRLTGGSLQEIINNYPELIGLLGDEQSMRAELVDLIKEEEVLQRKALARKLEATETFYKNHATIYKNIFQDLANKYNIDVDNFRTMNEAKLSIAAELQSRMAKLNNSITVGTTVAQVEQNIKDLNQQTADLSDGAIAKFFNGGQIKKNEEALEILNDQLQALKNAEKVADQAVAKIDLTPINTSMDTKKSKKSTQQFVEILRIMPRYAAQLDDLTKSYDKATTAHEKLFKRINADKYFSDNHTTEFFTAQVANMQELYALQGKALAQQVEIKKIITQASTAYKKQTGLQVDASNAEAAYLNWKQGKETAIHNLTQKQKFIENEATKNAYAERIKAIQHEIALADYHRNAWDKATTQLESLDNKWWELFSTMQTTMETLTNTTIEKIGKFKDAMIETINASRGEFGRYNRVDDIHQLDLLMLDLQKLQKQFVSTSGSFNTSSLSNNINKVNIDTKALLNTINALNDERQKIINDKNLSEVEKQELLNELIEKQIKLEKELDKEKQAILEKLNAMELEHRAIENAMENRIKIKEEELKALQKQKQIEEKIRQEQQKQLDLLRAMDDTRFSYITGLGEEIFTFDRSKLKDLESNIDANDNKKETQLQEEIDKMNEQLNDYKEANRIAEETLRVLLGINDNLFSTLSSDIDKVLENLEQVFDQMTEKLTNNIGLIFDKWYDAQSKKDTKTAKDILNLYKSMDSLMKAMFKESLPKLDSFDTGGYTGNWSGDGKLAMVHQKELILNEQDTSRILEAINLSKKLDFVDMAIKRPAIATNAITNNKDEVNVILHNPKFVTENANTFGKDMLGLAKDTLSRLG